MSRRVRSASALLGGALALLAPVVPASANQFCVAPASGCSGGQKPTLQAALDAALTAPGHDAVQLPAGTVDGQGKYESANPDNTVDVVGAGRDATVVTASAGEPILALNQLSGLVSDLTVRQGIPNQELGFIRGTAERVGFISTDSSGSVSLLGIARQIVARGYGYVRINGTLEDADLRGAFLATGTTSTIVRRVRVEAPSPVFGQNSSLVISSSVFIATDPNTYIAVFSPSPVENSHATTLLSNVTLIGPNSPNCTGLGVFADNAYPPPKDFAVQDATLASSIVRGCGTSIERNANSANRTANLRVFASDLDLSPLAVVQVGAGTLTAGPGDGNVNTDPLFLGLPDFSQALPFNSPLVDRGLASGLSPEESATDLHGAPRVVDGNGDGVAVRDMGAYEYQRHPPEVTVSAPKQATAGKAIQLTGAATESDPGESVVAYSWKFDDGKTEAGLSISHKFAMPGKHAATLLATDNAGATGSAQAAVDVLGGAVHSVSISPRAFRASAKGASASRRKPASGARVRVKLSGPSRLRLTVRRKVKGGKTVKLPGRIVRKVGAPLRFRFSGRWHGAPLPGGRYQLTVKGSTGKPRSARFRILRGQ